MKKKSLFACLGVFLLLSACQKDEIPVPPGKSEIQSATSRSERFEIRGDFIVDRNSTRTYTLDTYGYPQPAQIVWDIENNPLGCQFTYGEEDGKTVAILKFSAANRYTLRATFNSSGGDRIVLRQEIEAVQFNPQVSGPTQLEVGKASPFTARGGIGGCEFEWRVLEGNMIIDSTSWQSVNVTPRSGSFGRIQCRATKSGSASDWVTKYFTVIQPTPANLKISGPSQTPNYTDVTYRLLENGSLAKANPNWSYEWYALSEDGDMEPVTNIATTQGNFRFILPGTYTIHLRISSTVSPNYCIYELRYPNVTVTGTWP